MSKPPPAPQGGGWVSETRQHRKALSALSWDATGLWRQLRGYCADMGLDGRLPKSKLHVAVERKITLRRAEAVMAELLDEELIADDGDCWVLDWSDQPSAEIWNDPVKRMRWARGKKLHRDTELCKRIKDRDRNLCRYCGVRVDWNVKTLSNNVGHGGTYDHVDPDIEENTALNVVVSCRRCNGRKRDRTPAQWILDDPLEGRTLKKPGTTSVQADEIDRARRAAA